MWCVWQTLVLQKRRIARVLQRFQKTVVMTRDCCTSIRCTTVFWSWYLRQTEWSKVLQYCTCAASLHSVKGLAKVSWPEAVVLQCFASLSLAKVSGSDVLQDQKTVTMIRVRVAWMSRLQLLITSCFPRPSSSRLEIFFCFTPVFSSADVRFLIWHVVQVVLLCFAPLSSRLEMSITDRKHWKVKVSAGCMSCLRGSNWMVS